MRFTYAAFAALLLSGTAAGACVHSVTSQGTGTRLSVLETPSTMSFARRGLG